MHSNLKSGIVLALTAAMFWGISGTVGQFLFQQRGVDVKWLITVRLLLSGVLLLVYGYFSKGTDLWAIWKDRRSILGLIIFSITGITAVQYTYFEAIKQSNAATATVLQYLGPVLIAVYLSIQNRRMPSAVDSLAILLAVVGTFLLVTHGDYRQLTITRTALFFGLASAVTLAIYTLQPIPLLNKYGSLPVLGWGMLIGGMIFSLISPPWVISGTWDLPAILSIAFIIVFATAIAFLLYLNAVQLIGAQKSSLLASAEPLAATLLAVVWLGVSFGWMDWAGSICIVSTVFLLSRKD